MTAHGVLRLPARILFGPGERLALPGVLGPEPRRVFIVADRFLATTTEFGLVLDALRTAGHEASVYTEVDPELPAESLTRAADVARDTSPHAIVGYGGGSALDACKLIALLVSHGGPLDRFYGENAVPGPILPVIALPTTAGTGSEVTPVAVVTDSRQEMKVGVSSPHLIPWAAIVDPELTLAAPASVTAHSGIDALVHAVESYTAAELDSWPDADAVFVGRNALSEPLSLEAVRLIGGNLARAVEAPADLDARTAMSRGSLLAGMAFGSTGTHISHALQYPIGALTHTPHGLGTGLMLPYVLQAIASSVPDRIERVGQALGTEPSVPATIEAVAELTRRIGLPGSLAEIGVAEEDLPRMAGLAMRSARLVRIAPVTATPELLETILRAAHAGDRSLIPG